MKCTTLLHSALIIFLQGSALRAADAPATNAATEPATAPVTPNYDNALTGDWGGLRRRWAEHGFGVGAILNLEGFKNLRGGIDTAHFAGAATFDLNFTLDTEKAWNFKGGEFSFDLQEHAFRNPSTALVGDVQVFDELTADPYLQVFELWYQQTLGNGKLRLKVGKIDQNTEFSDIENGLPFINSSTNTSPAIFVLPTTPDPMPSADLFFTPNDRWFLSLGVSYANRQDRFGDLVGDPAKAQLARYGSFFIGETGVKWKSSPLFKFGGNFKAGVWAHSGTFPRFDGSQQHGAFGEYAFVNQTLWQPAGEAADGRGVRAFINCGSTQKAVSPVDYQLGGGITLTGLAPGRAGDIMGVGAEYAHLSPQTNPTHPYELAIETFYQWQIASWATLQPDIQYIVHPSGIHPNALVVTLRLQITF